MRVKREPYPLWDVVSPAEDRYELVMVTSRRSKQVNDNRLARQRILGVPVEEKAKPTTHALEEIRDGFIKFEYSESTKVRSKTK